MAEVLTRELDEVLKGTSRSFFLSLKNLPKKIRSQISLLYLLARASDTIADSNLGDPKECLELLNSYNDYVQGRLNKTPDFSTMANIQENQYEKNLLQKIHAITSLMGNFSENDQFHIRRCLGIIISGQSSDLERFSLNKANTVTALESNDQLDEYAYRVAGSVGEFWTNISLEHILRAGDEERTSLLDKSVRFGKALQLINILRDIPADLKIGRSYIPSENLSSHGLSPSDLMDYRNMEIFRPLYDQYLDLASEYLDSAADYVSMLPFWEFRLRASCMLPIVIGRRTISLLRVHNVLNESDRIKVPRAEIRGITLRILASLPLKGRSRAILF